MFWGRFFYVEEVVSARFDTRVLLECLRFSKEVYFVVVVRMRVRLWEMRV